MAGKKTKKLTGIPPGVPRDKNAKPGMLIRNYVDPALFLEAMKNAYAKTPK